MRMNDMLDHCIKKKLNRTSSNFIPKYENKQLTCSNFLPFLQISLHKRVSEQQLNMNIRKEK